MGNQLILPGSSVAPTPQFGLAGQVNPFMASQAAMQYQMNLPDYQNLIGKQSENILSHLQGEVPQDVINQIITQAAERGIMTGSPGGQASKSSYLRALGLTSLGLQQQGAQNLSQVRADTPVAELFNPMSLYVPELLGQQELDVARSASQPQSQSTPFYWGPKQGTYLKRSGKWL